MLRNRSVKLYGVAFLTTGLLLAGNELAVSAASAQTVKPNKCAAQTTYRVTVIERKATADPKGLYALATNSKRQVYAITQYRNRLLWYPLDKPRPSVAAGNVLLLHHVCRVGNQLEIQHAKLKLVGHTTSAIFDAQSETAISAGEQVSVISTWSIWPTERIGGNNGPVNTIGPLNVRLLVPTSAVVPALSFNTTYAFTAQIAVGSESVPSFISASPA